MGKPARPPALKLTGKARTVLREKGLPETSAGLERLGELTALDAVRHLHSMGSPLNTKALEQASKRVAAKTGLPWAKLFLKASQYKALEKVEDPLERSILGKIREHSEKKNTSFLPSDASPAVRSKVQELTAVLGSSHTYRAERHATQRLAHDLVNEIKGLDPRITLSMLSAELKRHVRPSKRHAMTPERLAEIKLDPGSYSTEAAERNWRLRNRTRKDFTKRQPAAMDLHVPGRERLAREVEYLLGNAEAEKLARNKVHEVALRHGMTFHKLRKLLLKEASLLGLERAAKRLASVKPPTKQLLGWVSRDYGTQRAKYHLAEAAPESIAEREKERERIELERQRVRKEILNSKPGKATNPQMFLLNEARSLFDGVELDDLLRVMKSKTRSRAVLYAINSHFGNAPKITMEDLQERGKGRKTTK